MGDELGDIRYIINSKYRQYVVQDLSEGISYPTKIKDNHDARLPNISRALTELRERNIVEVVADEHPGKLYALTDYGETLVERIYEEELF